MSISKFTWAMAVAVALLGDVAGTAHAEDLAGKVAEKLRDSGAMAGYRVKVRAKSGTVWLEGQVADAKQLAAAVGMAEGTEGVERVVNRLSIVEKPAADDAAASSAFTLPSSIRSLVSLPTSARPATAEDAAKAEAAPGQASETEKEPAPIKLAQAVAPAGRPQAATSRPSPAAPKAATRTTPPRPFGMPTNRAMLPAQAAGRPQPARPGSRPGAKMAAAPGKRVMRTSAMGEPMELPAPGEHGAVGDGQMVPGSMRITEGPSSGGYGGDDAYAGGAGDVAGPAGMGAGGPMAMRGTGVGMPPVPMRGDGPNMPNYAWPSYAAYPNYAALQYPTQYSPTAWPYIGPFYPYPQVPLGWRRVSLEWDDGWWFLDFDDRHHHSHHR
jgi:hypothetical protein